MDLTGLVFTNVEDGLDPCREGRLVAWVLGHFIRAELLADVEFFYLQVGEGGKGLAVGWER